MTAPALRASAASRWVNCPEAAWLEARYPDKESGAAKEGTAAHEMAEMILTGTVDGPIELFDRQSSNGIIFTDEMADPVMMYVDHVRSHGSGFWVEESIAIDCDGITVTGTCDGASFCFDQNNGVLYIDDFKYGHGSVDVVENWQLLIYGFGIIAKHQIGHAVKEIVMTIVQPRSWHHAGPIRSWTIDQNGINYYFSRLVTAAKAVVASDRQCQTGQHCRYCVAHAFCNAAKSASMNAVDVAEAALPDTDTPEQVAALLATLERASDAIKHTLGAVETRAEAMILNGQPIPGRSLQPGSGKRKWVDENATRAMGDALGIKLVDEKVVTPAEAKRRGISKAVVESLTTVPSTAPRLIKTDATSKANEVFK